jgi:hypothetical protein
MPLPNAAVLGTGSLPLLNAIWHLAITKSEITNHSSEITNHHLLVPPHSSAAKVFTNYLVPNTGFAFLRYNEGVTVGGQFLARWVIVPTNAPERWPSG